MACFFINTKLQKLYPDDTFNQAVMRLEQNMPSAIETYEVKQPNKFHINKQEVVSLTISADQLRRLHLKEIGTLTRALNKENEKYSQNRMALS